jgi:hypothetical protein
MIIIEYGTIEPIKKILIEHILGYLYWVNSLTWELSCQ